MNPIKTGALLVAMALAAGAWAIECRGTAELSNDETLIQEVTHRALVKALVARQELPGDEVRTILAK